MNRNELRFRQSRDAVHILSTAPVGKPGDDAIWAVGVMFAQHIQPIVQTWNGTTLLGGSDYQGGASLDGARHIDLHARHAAIRAVNDQHNWADIVHVRLVDVHRLIVDQARIPRHLVDEAAVALTARREHVDLDMAIRDRQMHEGYRETDEQIRIRGTRWAAIEGHCYDLGARIWETARPQAQPEQLGLFAIAGAR